MKKEKTHIKNIKKSFKRILKIVFLLGIREIYLSGRNIYGLVCHPFLTIETEHKALKLFFNLDYDIRSIIKYLPKRQQQELYYENQTVFQDIVIRWLPGKSFTLKYGRLNYTYYDIAQFYNMSLDKAGQKYLNTGKTGYDVSNLTEWDFRPACS